MATFWKTAATLLALLAAGCVTPTSVNPVGITIGLHRDLALVGTWRDDYLRVDEGDVITVAPVGDSMTAFRVSLPANREEQGSFDLYEFSTVTLGQNHFINARRIRLASDENKDPNGWMPLYYTIKPSGLSAKLYYLDQNKLAKTIESGALKGQIGKHKDSDGRETIDSLTITAEPAELDAFMAKPDAVALFTLYRRYRKVD